jgi:hypothetical protein
MNNVVLMLPTFFFLSSNHRLLTYCLEAEKDIMHYLLGQSDLATCICDCTVIS